MKLHCEEPEVSYLGQSKEKLNHLIKADGDKLVENSKL